MKKKFWLPLVAFGFFALALSNSNEKVEAIHISDFKNKDEYAIRAKKVFSQIGEEGTVLLKNDNFLPMKGNEKISIFGKSSVRLARYGAAAGGGNSIVPFVDIYTSLENAGFSTNNALKTFYNYNNKSGVGRTNGNTGWTGISEVTIGETGIESYDEELISSFANYNDAAIFVITRESTEGADIKTSDTRDFKDSAFSNRHALEMSENEEALYSLMKEHFNHIIVVLDSPSPFECEVFNNDPKTSAIIWTGGYSGAVGIAAIGKILNGSVNPSGRTVDTWARDFTKNPTFKNFGDNSQTNLINTNDTLAYVPQDTMYTSSGDPVKSLGTLNGEITWADETNKVPASGINGVRPASYVKYEEDIYVDYRYYETKYNDLAISNKDNADNWYNSSEGVLYPFGYGLSYTKFAKRITKVNLDKETNEVKATVCVENIGNVAGKEVVQLYWNAPYRNGGIEKASEVLCAFGKTEKIKAKEKTYLNLSFNLEDVANYDAFDSNANGFRGYEIESGTYSISLRENAHEQCKYVGNDNEYVKYDIQINEGLKFDKDRYTGNDIKNRFTSTSFSFFDSLPNANDIKFTRLTRNGGINVNTIGQNDIASRTLKANSRVEEYLCHKFSIKDVDLTPNEEYISSDVHVSKEEAIRKDFKQSKTRLADTERVQAKDMMGVSFEDKRWDSFLNEFTYDELCDIITPNMRSPANSYIHLKSGSEGAGPGCFSLMQITSSSTLAATYNVKLAQEVGDCIGEEGNLSGKYGWWAPYATIRRSPFAGSSCYYYSADPLVTGKMAANIVKSAKAKGVICYVNGFGLGNQEKNREGGIVYASEQAIREIYLKSFQYVVEEGEAVAITTSYQRIGLVEAANNYPLLHDILKNEWGFKGVVLGDMTHSSNRYIDFDCFENFNYRVLSGLSTQLDSEGIFFKNYLNCKWDDDAFDGKGAPVFEENGVKYESYSWWNALRNSAKERLFIAINYADIQGNNIVSSENIHVTTIFSADEDKDAFIEVDENKYVIKVGSSVVLGIECLNELDGCSLYIDPSTPLPDGLIFKDDSITGTPTKEGTSRIHILAKKDGSLFGKAIEIEVKKVSDDSEPNKPKGCSASIGSGLGIFAATSILAGTILLVINRKRKLA